MKYYSCDSLNRPEVRRWYRRIKECYSPPEDIKLTVVLPCSAKKPYSTSKSHITFRKAIKAGAGKKLNLVHEVTLTSPLGMVPRELEELYPACCYDTSVTGYWSEEEKSTAEELIRDYAGKAHSKIVGYCSEAYAEILDSAGIEVIARDDLLGESNLNLLSRRIRDFLGKEERIKRNKNLEKLRAVAEFQFGKGMGEIIIHEGAKLRRNDIYYKDKKIARLHQRYGYLNLTIEGADALAEKGKYNVFIDFMPETNSIFCAGIIDADRAIVPGDEVAVVYKEEVVGVGRAVLNGMEMLRAERGMAVKLRKRRKQIALSAS
ncbi:PUA domain protein [archaeon]|nr:PUA domain protein [archaeon]